MKRIILSSICSLVSAHCFAGSTPIFLVTPNISVQSSLMNGEIGSAVYQVTNNTQYTLSNIGLAQMPAGITPDTSSVSSNSQYCSNPFTLTAGSSCLLKVTLDTSQLSGGVSSGPIICYSQSTPIYCSQPYTPDRLNMSVTQDPIPQDCDSNYANFNYELSQNFDSTSVFSAGWGPGRNPLPLSPSNPDLTNCPTSAGVTWEQKRVIAAAAFWIAQKLNYCHHYNPDYATPTSLRSASGTDGGYCNPAVDTMPGSVYYGQQARWNYSGEGSETANNWVNNNQMWYGMDCSNTTSFIYNFAFGTNTTLGIPFDSKTNFQAGQEGCPGNINCPQDNLSPNQQNVGSFAGQYLDNASRAGYLVCVDGTVDANSGPNSAGTPTLCAGHGGYLSGINSSGTFTKTVTVAQVAAVLQPGDMLYIAGAGPDPQPNPDGSTSEVTHVIMWTGKQVGTGADNIDASLVAPNDAPCADQSIWQPNTGDWLIADSHYQGYDYRVLTTCFYLNDLWGVRRVIV
ncbi:MAG: hypothetical protein SFW66_04380 [Gammaproteobacteria bacterium]|nr:hypothetical protein [Gammaproteobacteria bacterium]